NEGGGEDRVGPARDHQGPLVVALDHLAEHEPEQQRDRREAALEHDVTQQPEGEADHDVGHEIPDGKAAEQAHGQDRRDDDDVGEQCALGRGGSHRPVELCPTAGSTPTKRPLAAARVIAQVDLKYVTTPSQNPPASLPIREMAPALSARTTACVTAKSPTRAWMSGTPSSMGFQPNVKRRCPVMTSDPTVASIRPRPPEIRPLTTEPCTTAATSDSASTAVRKYPAGPHRSE